MHINDLMQSLRSAGYFSLNEVHIAIVETNGTLSVLPKFKNTEVTNDNLNIDGKDKTLPFSLILEGKIMSDTLNKYGLIDKNKLLEFIKSYKLKVNQIYLFSIDKSGEFYLQPYNQQAITGSITLWKEIFLQ